MCILFVYTNPQPQNGAYRLIIASNRDEYYARPARTCFQCPKTQIIGGRDMEPGREGGMWLGVSCKGTVFKFAALLNVTGAPKIEATKGRGPLVYNFLESTLTAPQYFNSLSNDSYSAFNLFTMEIEKEQSRAYHHSNSPLETMEFEGLQVLAFGNSTPKAPLAKVQKGKERFKAIVDSFADKTELITNLLGLLKTKQRFLPDDELKTRAPAAYEFLSSPFVEIVQGGYGTRTHSIVLVDSEFNVEFIEHTLKKPIDIENPHWEETTVRCRL